MTTKGKRPMRALTASDKIEAIQRVNDGESKASVARDIGVPESTLRGWCKNEDKLRYMSSRRSSPDTDKSNDGEPPDKRARTISPITQTPAPLQMTENVESGLDLSATAIPATLPSHVTDAPVELTTRRNESSPHVPRDRRPDPGASVSMSAISPLSGLAHIPGISHSHLGLSFNEIATNLTLLAQLNPGLSSLSAAPASRALRSVRSPKPSSNGALNLTEKHRSKTHSDHYSSRSKPKDSVDETLWYWLKTQQAMLDLTAQTNVGMSAHPLQLPKASDPLIPPKPIAPVTPTITPHLDYNRNSWIWQYYKQFGGAIPPPEDKLKPAAQVPKEKTENILYSHLTKGKTEDIIHEEPRNEPVRMAEEHIVHLSTTPDTENKEPQIERCVADSGRNHSKARNVLDNLLFNNNNEVSGSTIIGAEASGDNTAEGAEEALQHGDKFLSWLEASGDPTVTRVHLHQLRTLLQNLRARRLPK